MLILSYSPIVASLSFRHWILPVTNFIHQTATIFHRTQKFWFPGGYFDVDVPGIIIIIYWKKQVTNVHA